MKLVIGDRHCLFADALRDELSDRGHDVVDCCYDLDSVVSATVGHRPDLCILEATFDGRSALPAAAEIRARTPEVGVVLLTGAATAEVWQAFDVGHINAVVNKLCDTLVLNRTLEAVASGSRVVERFTRPLSPRPGRTGLSALSDRELAVLRLLVGGASTEDIAGTLLVSTQTVRTHVQSILRKLEVNSRSRAARLGFELGVDTCGPPGSLAQAR